MNHPSGISVVIPALNSERFIERAVASARDCGYPAVEIIVVDNGSSDKTREIALGLGVELLAESERGAGAARNRGLRAARHDYLLFLDSDDLLIPGSLGLLLEAAETSNADFTHGQIQNLVDDSYSGNSEALAHTTNSLTAPLASNTLVKRSALDRFGPMAADNVSWPRLVMTARRQGASFCAVEHTVALRIIHDSNVSHDPQTRVALAQVLRDLPSPRQDLG